MKRIIKDGEDRHYTVSAFRNFHPEVHFVNNPSESVLEQYGWKFLREDPKPQTSEFEIAERGPVERRDGVPYWTWTVRAMTADEQEEYLSRKRSNLRAYKRAFRFALDQVPYTANTTLLEAIQADIDSRPFNDSAKRAWEDVTIYERSHPDMALLYSAGLTDEQIDDIFDVAIAFETDPGAFANT